MRISYICFRDGKLVDDKGYREIDNLTPSEVKKAMQEAYMLCCLYNYTLVSLEHPDGRIIAIVNPSAKVWASSPV